MLFIHFFLYVTLASAAACKPRDLKKGAVSNKAAVQPIPASDVLGSSGDANQTSQGGTKQPGQGSANLPAQGGDKKAKQQVAAGSKLVAPNGGTGATDSSDANTPDSETGSSGGNNPNSGSTPDGGTGSTSGSTPKDGGDKKAKQQVAAGSKIVASNGGTGATDSSGANSPNSGTGSTSGNTPKGGTGSTSGNKPNGGSTPNGASNSGNTPIGGTGSTGENSPSSQTGSGNTPSGDNSGATGNTLSSASTGGGKSASFTSYGAGDTFGSGNCNVPTTACGFYTNPGYAAAVSQSLFGVGPGAGAGPACGQCFRLTPVGAGTKEIVVKVNNLCPADGNPLCAAPVDVNVNFDLCNASGAAEALFGSSATGQVNGTYAPVSCSEWSGGPNLS